MKFCQEHWDRLRAKIDERGLAHLVGAGDLAAAQVKDQLKQGVTPVNFDPLMSAHWGIVANVVHVLEAGSADAPGDVLYLMSAGPEEPVAARENCTWPRCPLCFLNLAHDLACTDERCTLDRERGYDWMLDRAADEAKAQAEQLAAS